MRWRSCRTPVAIAVAHTGVTDGNAAHSSGTNAPRSMIAASAGASPRSMARWTIDGLAPSMTARSRRFIGSSAQDPQARVLLVAAPASGDQERDQEADRDDRQRREQDARARDDRAGDLAVERQRGGGRGV